MMVVADHRVDARDDIPFLRRRERARGIAEVEAHPIDADPRSGLNDIVAQRILERALQ